MDTWKNFVLPKICIACLLKKIIDRFDDTSKKFILKINSQSFIYILHINFTLYIQK